MTDSAAELLQLKEELRVLKEQLESKNAELAKQLEKRKRINAKKRARNEEPVDYGCYNKPGTEEFCCKNTLTVYSGRGDCPTCEMVHMILPESLDDDSDA